MSDGAESFAALLRRFRLAAGLTQEELAERAGLSVRGVSDLERGERRRPYRHTIEALAQGLGLDPANRALLVAASVESGPPALGTPAIPTPLTPVVGRNDEIAALRGLLQRDDVRLVTITGTGGVGKTRLALELIRALPRPAADGVFFVDLSLIRDTDAVPAAVAMAVGLQQREDAPVEGLLTTYLRSRHALLVLDNFEQVVDAGPAISRLLGACPGLRALLTSRTPLRVAGEHLFPLRPLQHPDTRHIPAPDTLLRYPAVTLFVDRARATVPTFALSDTNATDVAIVCARLDGLPLAIELAAARLPVVGLATLAERLERPLATLTVGMRDAPDRQRTLRETIGWSYDLLSVEEQRLLRTLAVFEGGWTIATAEALGGAATLDRLGALLDSQLIVAVEETGERRFSMLVAVRDFLLEQLDLHNESAETRGAHAAIFDTLAVACERDFKVRYDVWCVRYAPELDNFRAALRWSIARGDHRRAQRMVAELFWLFEFLGLQHEHLDWALAARRRSG